MQFQREELYGCLGGLEMSARCSSREELHACLGGLEMRARCNYRGRHSQHEGCNEVGHILLGFFGL